MAFSVQSGLAIPRSTRYLAARQAERVTGFFFYSHIAAGCCQFLPTALIVLANPRGDVSQSVSDGLIVGVESFW